MNYTVLIIKGFKSPQEHQPRSAQRYSAPPQSPQEHQNKRAKRNSAPPQPPKLGNGDYTEGDPISTIVIGEKQKIVSTQEN